MRSLIYQGDVSHWRLAPTAHGFRYPVYFYAFDLDELPELARRNPLFGYNRLRPVAIHDKDYLLPGAAPLREKLQDVLRQGGIDLVPARVVLVTAARYFNYVFNPISFFYCYDENKRLRCVLIQVNNTFGEMHLYLLSDPVEQSPEGRLQFHQDKQFHVSPFFERQGHYRFTLSEPGAHLENQIHYYQSQQLMLVARLRGEARLLTPRNLLRTLVAYPLSAALTMPRILWQAAKLHWRKKLPVYAKPVPEHAMTVRPAPAGWLDRIGRAVAFRFLARLPQGELSIHLPDGSRRRFGQADTKPQVHLTIRDNRFFRRVLLAGDIGFGEAYTDGDWTTDDLPGLLTLLAKNDEVLDDRGILTAILGRGLNYARHLLRANTLKGSADNIRAHYDLSNAFFATFLDLGMTYSAARFRSDQDTLEQAQRHKIDEIIAKAGITQADHVLEIGCGWGSFALAAARQTGCRVTGITLSREQLHLAQQRVRDAGLAERIDLQLKDYRQVEGRYSKIVSIEMLEAVGHAGLKAFFAACDRALLPGGKAVIQVITIADRKYGAYRFSSDWIRKHIFPGGHLPSVGALAGAIGAASRLRIESLEHFGLDYARTLVLWRRSLLAQRAQLHGLGYDDHFLRTWDYYFSYCEAGFAARIIDVAQLVLEKPLS